jgi:hypothetical protein
LGQSVFGDDVFGWLFDDCEDGRLRKRRKRRREDEEEVKRRMT